MTAPATPPNPTTPGRTDDLEIKDAQLIFGSIWAELESTDGRENLAFPKEIFWLNGAPGAGKGTQTQFIQEYCGLSAPPVVMSDLLNSPEAQRLKNAGLMVGDREVTRILFRRLLDPSSRLGVVVDGYPRTNVQVVCLKLFYQRLMELRKEFRGTPWEGNFPKPVFHIIVLYIDEATSVQRQLLRGQQMQEALEHALLAGQPAKWEVRPTDLSPETARNRYRTFKEITFETLTSLREVFHYHFINAQDSIAKVQEKIVAELRYQSSLELDQATLDLISVVPIASVITANARQELVKRLDNYALHQAGLFTQVLNLMETKFVPIILRHAISGMAMFNTEDAVFNDPLALAMLIDVFSERGYQAVADVRLEEVPDRIDLATGIIQTRVKRVYRFRVRFQGSVIRRGR